MIKIALFGVALNSNNYGCSALGISQIDMLQKIAVSLDLNVEYHVFSGESSAILTPLSNYIRTDNIVFEKIVRFRTGLRGIIQLRKAISKCDLVIDLTYGDSFSDIYGLKNFLLFSVPKYIAIKVKKTLILGPQTIGPFYSKLAQRVARRILRKSQYVFARDELSSEQTQILAGRVVDAVTSDLAMELPYIKGEYSIDRKEGALDIGLNVSRLMWDKNSYNSKLNVSLDYRKLICALIEHLSKQGITVHLITHVYDRSDYNEYSLACDLHKQYPDTVLAPEFKNPMDAKSYMSELDLFIGSRMHATIGAFSAGVPVIPISYSRKFEGLYGAIGYDHCIDCSKESVDSALDRILEKINLRVQLEANRKQALNVALNRNSIYNDRLKSVLIQINNG